MIIKAQIVTFLVTLTVSSMAIADGDKNPSSMQQAPTETHSQVQAFLSQKDKTFKTLIRDFQQSGNSRPEGPGRSGGGNGVVTSGADNGVQFMDGYQSREATPIRNWLIDVKEFPEYLKHVQMLSANIPDLSEYLTLAFSSKEWRFVHQPINVKGCLNSTVVGAKQVAIIACQWNERGYIRKDLFDLMSRQDRLLLLLHEALVHHMLKNLEKLEKFGAKTELDGLQAMVELRLHEISVKLLRNKYAGVESLRKDLVDAGLPTILTAQEKESLVFKQNRWGLVNAKDVFLGSKEKYVIMEKLYNKAGAFNPDQLRAKFGKEVCFANQAGYSIPGYWALAYFYLDELIPEVFYSVPWEREFDKTLVPDFIKVIMSERTLMIPLQEEDKQWGGSFELTVLGPRKSVLTVRQSGDVVFIKRELYGTDNGPMELLEVNYGMGKVSGYPGCLNAK